MDTWKKIETAPKDGLDILMFDQGETTIAYWSRAYARWFDKTDPEYQWRFTPTHWMPLPEPPKETK